MYKDVAQPCRCGLEETVDLLRQQLDEARRSIEGLRERMIAAEADRDRLLDVYRAAEALEAAHIFDRQDKFLALREALKACRPAVPGMILETESGVCGCCLGTGDHECGHECDSCDGSGRQPDSPICRLPHGADCRCTNAQRQAEFAEGGPVPAGGAYRAGTPAEAPPKITPVDFGPNLHGMGAIQAVAPFGEAPDGERA